MKRKIIAVLIFIIIFSVCLVQCAYAQEVTDDNIWYSDVYESAGSEARELLSGLGIDDENPLSVSGITPPKVFSVIRDIFFEEKDTPIAGAAVILGTMLTVSAALCFLPQDSKYSELVTAAGQMFIAFTLLSKAAGLIDDSFNCIGCTHEFMLALIPVLAGIVTFSGSPMLALSFNTVVFGFAEGVGALFSNVIPGFSAVYSAIAVSSAINPLTDMSKVAVLIKKAAMLIMGFTAGIFVAVLSVRGVIAGAADTVTIKGLRFLIGSSVPVVGSAIGDALNSVVAGLGLAKSTVGMLAVIVLAVLALPGIVEIVIWKIALYVLTVISDVLGQKKTGEMLEAVGGMFSLLIAVILFNVFVFIISVAIVITVKAG